MKRNQHQQSRQSAYSLYMSDIEECRDEQQLLKVVEAIMNGTKQNNIDEYQLDKLEQAGIRKYERLRIESERLIKNR